MITKIVPIGNSKGIRIPNNIIKELGIENQIELCVDEKESQIILKPVRKPREEWDRAFKTMAEKHDDDLIIADSIDLDAWEW